MQNKPVEVFFSYSHRDEKLRDELEKHLSILKRNDVIAAWHDRQIPAGNEWAGEIDEHLQTAQIILLLVSADFLASDYCYSIEMETAIKRHDAKEARVIPVILRPVDWKDARFARLQALPKNAKPITSWDNQDEAFADVACGIRAVVRSMRDHDAHVDEMLKQFRQRISVVNSVYELGQIKSEVEKFLNENPNQAMALELINDIETALAQYMESSKTQYAEASNERQDALQASLEEVNRIIAYQETLLTSGSPVYPDECRRAMAQIKTLNGIVVKTKRLLPSHYSVQAKISEIDRLLQRHNTLWNDFCQTCSSGGEKQREELQSQLNSLRISLDQILKLAEQK